MCPRSVQAPACAVLWGSLLATQCRIKTQSALKHSIAINNKYEGHNSEGAPALRAKNQKAAVTVMADVAAAGTAAATMGGLWVMSPWGTLASAFVTVCAGASASALAHTTQQRVIIPSNPGGSDPIYNHANAILANRVLELDANPYNNPFDSIGFQHNELVKRYYTTPNNYLSPNSQSFLFNSQNLSVDENNYLASTKIQSLINVIGYQYANPIEDSTSLSIYLNNAYGLYNSNQFLVAFSHTLLEGMYNCTTYDQIISLVHDYEKYYVANFNGTDMERRVVLISLSTAKYSAQLWKLVNED